ncbi:MAG: hypothetical protein AAGA72_17650, partial [Pseudomonadota bacterium]
SRAQIATFPIFILSTFFALSYFERYDYPTPPAQELVLEPRSLEGIAAAPRLAQTAGGELTGNVQVRLSMDGARLNAKSARLQLYRDETALGAPVEVPVRLQIATVPISISLAPEALSDADEMRAVVELASGRVLEFDWLLRLE